MQTFATLCTLNESILLRSVAHYAMDSHNIHSMDCLVRETKQTSIKEDDPSGDTLFDSNNQKNQQKNDLVTFCKHLTLPGE